MKIAEIIAARSVWLFDMYELNPRGVSSTTIYTALLKRYRFMRYPQRPDEFARNGHEFTEGTFSRANKGDLQLGLQIFADGLIAETRSSTEDTDAFLEEMLQMGKEQLGLNYHPGLVKTKSYFSNVTVLPDFDLTSACEKIASFCKVLTSFQPAGQSGQQHVFSISFKSDPLATHAFTFERRESNPPIPFSENKYFSQAALPTGKHIKLLESFEEIMRS